jgi:hypothetical protein
VSNIVTLAAMAIKVCKHNEAEFRAAGEAAEYWDLTACAVAKSTAQMRTSRPANTAKGAD